MSDTTTTETVTIEATTEEPAPETGPDLTAEVEKWKSAARKYEDQAKSGRDAAKELEKLKQASMSDLEKAVNDARAEARAETLIELGSGRVDDAVRVAATGRNVDIDALLEGLDRRRFLDDDGTPDRDAIAAWVDRLAPVDTKAPFPDLGQGVRTSASADPGPGKNRLLAAYSEVPK